MSVEVDLRKFQNQFKNGVDLDQNPSIFTHFLLGFIGQKMKRTTRIATQWTAEANLSNKFVTTNGDNIATRSSGSWIDDGFQIGDTVDYRHPSFNEIKQITNVTDLVVTFDTDFSNTSDNEDVVMFGTTRLRGINYFSNFVENDDPAGYISKVDNINDKKWTGDFTITEYNNLTLINATPSGLQDSWKMGSDAVTMQMIELPILANSFTQILEVVETFTITPFFDNISNLEGGLKPDYLAGAKSLRSVAKVELLHTTLNPIIKHILDDSENPDTNGNVGYYDEHFNGNTPVEFTKDSIVYVNASNENKIVIDELTSITCKIDSLTNVLSQNNSKFQMNLIFLNEDLDNFETIDTNFAFDTVFGVADGSSKGGENGIFSNVVGNIVANQLVVTADITFSAAQQSLIEDGKYIIAIATDDHTVAIDQSLAVNVNMDINEFVKNNDIPDLMAIDTNFFYEHPHDKGTQGKTDFQGWVEDGILMSADFTLDLSLDAVILNMNVRLMARNSVSGDDFEIACIPLDFTSAIISGGVQQIDIDSERGFKLVEDSQFNFIKVKTLAQVVDLQHYDLDIGFKLQWMDWQALADADPVFFDNSEINDGLNRLISNYSALNDYDIVMFIDAQVSNGVANTNYRFISPGLRTFEYETDDTGDPSTKWEGLVETFDQSANNLNGNLHGTQNTEVKVTFTALSGVLSEAVLYGIIRLEEFQQGGLFNIFEISSFRNRLITDNPLIPKAGENKAIFTVNVDNVEVECAIDFSKLNPTSQYKISGRLGTACNETTGCAWESLNSGVVVSLLGTSFLDDTIGIVVGAGGTILKTTDSGDTWVAKPSGIGSIVLREVEFVSADIVYACGNAGKVIKSIDGGDTWADKSPVGLFIRNDIHFIDVDTGWVAGQSGKIFRTDDGGDNWTDQSIVTSTLNSIFFIDTDIGWACGIGGIIFKTIDGGTNWVAQVSGTTDTLADVFFFSDTVGWIAAHVDKILLTTDGGATWDTIALPTINKNFFAIYFIDADNGIICGDGGFIFRSTDGGNTWLQESTGTVNGLADAHMISLTSAYAVGSFGEIVRYSCTTDCDILETVKLQEDGTEKFKEDGNNKLQE